MRLVLFRLALATALAASLLSTAPAPAAAADGYTETAATTYVLDPVKDQLNVTVTITFKNTTSSVRTPYTCWRWLWSGWYWDRVADTCYQTTNYYYYSTRQWVEASAVGLKAKSGGSTLAVKLGAEKNGYKMATVTFPNLYYNKTRVITLTYSLPGGAPRSANELRVTQAYAHFCVQAAGVDSATVTVKVPDAYTVDVSGDPLGYTVRDGVKTYTSGPISDPSSFYSCLDGLNDAGYQAESLTGPNGLAIKLRSWPEDPQWAAAVKSDVNAGVGALTALIGKPMNVKGPLTVEEAVTGSEYAGFYNGLTNTVTVDEHYSQPTLVEHELAHAWFNRNAFEETWLSEGLAEWAGRAVAKDQGACAAPSTADAITVNLRTWVRLTPRSTDAERTALETQYTTACYVATALAAAAGPEGTQRALQALLDARDPYAVDPAARRALPTATWRDWLDAWDEIGLPAATGANATLAADLALRYGVTSDQAALDQRTAARTAYHALIAKVGDWVVPAAIRKPMSKWEFAGAQTAITAALPAWDITGQTDAALTGVDARHGPAAKAWAAATTEAELKAAADLAQQQLDAAKDVAAAGAEALKPLDFVQQVGMAGSVMPSLDPAVQAVRDGDASKAAAVTASVRSFLAGLQPAGQQRITIAVAVTVLLLVLLVVAVLLLRRRRRSASRLAVAALAASAASSAASAATAQAIEAPAFTSAPATDWAPTPAPLAPPEPAQPLDPTPPDDRSL